jgi:hypothetical protein
LTQPLTTNTPIPGLYPLIIHINPPQVGCDNMGMGFTQHNEQFLLKAGNSIGVAEYIGAKVCDAIGVPACQPNIVTINHLGVQRDVFGSRIESGAHKFDQCSVAGWQEVLANCSNADAFSALLAVDLALGNDDRHWNNWLVQEAQTPMGTTMYRLRAMDFSRSWPTRHPAQHPLKHVSAHTWNSIRHWKLLGVTFNEQAFFEACVTIRGLPVRWLRDQVLKPISGIFISPASIDVCCQWWEHHLRQQVVEAIYSLENGVRP